MKAIILSGFLGAGKTSLLLQLAAQITGSAMRERVAILENEIGKVSVDGATLRSQGIEVRELFAGCVCCTLTSEMAASIKEIEEHLRPDWLIIEATGLAFPDRTAEVVREHGKSLEQLKTVVLIDANHFLMLDSIVPLISGQPKFADVLLLNKVDLADNDTKQKTIARLREINPEAPLFQIVATEPLPDDLWQEVLR
jgi:G3E family GTPase